MQAKTIKKEGANIPITVLSLMSSSVIWKRFLLPNGARTTAFMKIKLYSG